MRSTFKVLFYVKKGSEKPNGNLPLMCRLTVDGEIKQFSCKMDVPLWLWDVKNNRASGKSVEAQRINRAVDKIRVEVNRRYQELMQTDGYVTAAKLKDAYLGIGVKQETLLKLFEQHNTEFAKKVGHSRAKGTFQRYVTVYKHIREFLSHTYKREDIPLKELNLTFINDFEYFLRTEKKCRTNTIWGYMIVLKHIISIARNDGRLPFNPFAGYINSPESVDRGYITNEEIHTMMNTDMPDKTHELVRDLFIFSTFTGLAYSDVKNLTEDNLQTFFDPKKENQHGIQYQTVGCSPKDNREVQRHDKGQQGIPHAEQHDLQQEVENYCRVVRYKIPSDLSCGKTFGSDYSPIIQRSTD